MVTLAFNDFYFFLNPLLLLTFLWFFFFKLNSNLQKITNTNTVSCNLLKINQNTAFVNFYFFLVFCISLNMYLVRGKNDLLWFNHFNLNNFNTNMLYLFIFISFTVFFLLKNTTTTKTNLIKSIDYVFSINNLVLIFPYLFFVNTIFTFLFLLELISVVLLYKLISSKIWFKNNNTKNINNNIPQNYINMIFFQYWVTFFSTIYIVYFYINIFYIYGTSEWFVLQFLNSVDLENNYTQSNMIRLLVLIFILGVFFKLGVTPFHLFKIEVYKGLPFLSIFFYTTYYFVVFFTFFVFLMSDFLYSFINKYYLFLVLILSFGSIYVVILLFDVTFLKAFFTYSTIINTIGFLTAFISIL